MSEDSPSHDPHGAFAFEDWRPEEVWFRDLVPQDLPWGDETLLEQVPESARKSYGLRVNEYATLDGQRYSPGDIILVGSAQELSALLGNLQKIVGIIVPWYDRLIPVSLFRSHHRKIDGVNYRREVSAQWVKSALITGGLVALGIWRPEFRMFAILFAAMFGLFPLVESTMAWFRRVERLSVDELNDRLVRNELFRLWVGRQPTTTLKIGVGALVLVFVAQFAFDAAYPTPPRELTGSIAAAALVKSEVIENREWWRLITTGLMHGGILHIVFNGMALFSLGRVIVALASPAVLTIVFLVSVVTGSVASLYLGSAPASVGASGGILGCLGFLLVVTFRFEKEIPDFLQASLVQSTIVIALFGMLGSQFIDNAAHGGGFFGGVAVGLLAYPFLRLSPGKTRPTVAAAAWFSLIILVAGIFKVGWELWKATSG
ncbi:MAG: rhomboid family intramembrane serine protease [Verrucomicrobiota bacterium]